MRLQMALINSNELYSRFRAIFEVNVKNRQNNVKN